MGTVVDSQIHLWPAETADRPWPPGGAQRAHLPYPMTYEAMLPLMDEAGVDRAIIVPPSWEGDRNDYALEAAQKYPDRFAVMGRIALNDPTARALLPSWRDHPSMLGIRLTFTEHQSSWLKDGTAAWFWPAAEAAGVPVMIHGREIARTVGEIAAAHPALRLILDHMGLNAGMAKAGRCAEGIAAMLPLAKLPNVSVKVSSAPTYSAESFPFRDMHDHIRRLVEAFGPERCFWGTDYTHSPEKCSYRQRLTHFTEHLEFLSAQDKNLITGSALLKCLGWHSAPQTSLPASVKKGIVQ